MVGSAWSFFGALRQFANRRKALHEFRMSDKEDLLYLLSDDSSYLNRTVQALHADDHSEALRCWRVACERHSALVMTWDRSVWIMSTLRLYDEAEAMMRDGRARFPHDPRYAEWLAQIAQNRGDLELATVRWSELRKKHPGRPLAFHEGASVYREAGRLEEAEKLIVRASRAFPEHFVCRMESARIAEARNDWEEALIRWESVIEKFGHIVGILGTARSLERLGRIAEAKGRLDMAKHSYPADKDLSGAIAHMSAAYPAD